MVISDGPFAKKNLNPKQKFVRHSVRQGLPMLLICGVMFLMAWASADVCVTMHPISASTRISRAIAGDVCANRDPCHVYVMVGRNMSNEMIVHWHSTRSYKAPTLFFDTSSHYTEAESSEYAFNVSAVANHMSQLEVSRYVYYATLSYLSPSTKYFIRVGDITESGPQLLGIEWSFETAPASVGPNETFHFVSGGDMGRTQVTQDLTVLAGKTNPLFAAIGGDLSYDNGIAACYGRWDAWFDLVENYLYAKPERRLVPLLVSIGNHEAGNFYAPEDTFTFYKSYFVQEPLPAGRNPNTLQTYQPHVIGNLLILSLDSFVYSDPAGPQAAWISAELEKSYSQVDSRILWRTAMYHAPQWPSVRKLEDSVSKACREAWGPIFDHYGVDIGFENHDHAYKRTKLMKAGQPVASNGTLFIGDGSWGVEDGYRSVPNRIFSLFLMYSN
jgi:acid phosphatase type 7